MAKRKLKEFVIDPSSGEFSMSRLCLGVLVLDVVGLSIADMMGIKITIMAHLTVIIGSVCGVYGLNTGLRVWRGKVIPPDKPAKPPEE